MTWALVELTPSFTRDTVETIYIAKILYINCSLPLHAAEWIDSSIENDGKGENVSYQHFFPFPTMYLKPVSVRVVIEHKINPARIFLLEILPKQSLFHDCFCLHWTKCWWEYYISVFCYAVLFYRSFVVKKNLFLTHWYQSTFVIWQTSAENQFVPEFVHPLACLSGLVIT